MSTYYTLLINTKRHLTLEQVEELLKTKFKSVDYMNGFLDGYLFDEYCLMTLSEYERAVREGSSKLNDKWLKVVEVASIAECDDE